MSFNSFSGSLLIIFLILTSFAVNAIVIRHDVDEEKYQASPEDFPALAQFYVDGAHGALIAPTWVITAAHCTFCTDPGSTILVGGKKVKVKNRYVHPGHIPGQSHDIALLELETPIDGIKPAIFNRDFEEKGKQVTFIGAGGFGNGLTGQTLNNTQNNGVLRKANNTVDEATGPLLAFVFHQGEQALPLEGIGGGGDSGGPAFVEQGEDYIVLGVSSRGEFGSTIGKYGNREFYSRLSYFKHWIDTVMHGTEQERQVAALPELKYLMPGLNKDTLPQLCEEISIRP